jgi:hypothetical protein
MIISNWIVTFSLSYFLASNFLEQRLVATAIFQEEASEDIQWILAAIEESCEDACNSCSGSTCSIKNVIPGTQETFVSSILDKPVINAPTMTSLYDHVAQRNYIPNQGELCSNHVTISNNSDQAPYYIWGSNGIDSCFANF